MAPQPSTWRGRSEQISLEQVGCEARKIPAEGDVFFLDFILYRTYQDLGSHRWALGWWLVYSFNISFHQEDNAALLIHKPLSVLRLRGRGIGSGRSSHDRKLNVRILMPFVEAR